MGKRMYYILKILQEKKGKAITGPMIVERLKDYDIYLDVKTVHAIIRRINEFFYEWIQGDMIVSHKKIGFTIENEFFSDGELQFLYDSISFHEDLRPEDKKLLQNKLFLLSSFHQHQRIVDFIPRHRKLSFSLFTNLNTIMKAIESKQVITFQYITYTISHNHLKETPSLNGNEEKQYIISPYQIVSQNNHYYLIGYNEKHKNELTTYRIDRMRLIQLMHNRFVEIREQFDMLDEIDKTTNMYLTQKRDNLQILCHQSVLREVASHFGAGLKAQKLHDNQYLITIEDIPISEGLIGWLMMLQSQIQVITPVFLREEMMIRVKKILTLYEDVV